MAPLTDGQWLHLVSLPFATPLVSLTTEKTLIAADLYRLGDCAYAFVNKSTWPAPKSELPPPCVTMFFWTPSDGAALRIVHRRIEDDDGQVGVAPSVLLSHFGVASARYADVLEGSRAHRSKGAMESASYRLDGKFIHKEIGWRDVDFYYRENDIRVDEIAYAIHF